MATKNKQTQCFFAYTFSVKKDVGVQTFQTFQSDKGLLENALPFPLSSSTSCNFSLKPKTLSTLAPVVKRSVTVNEATQTQIFGFKVAPHKWDEINNFVKARKRKIFVDKETCASDEDFQFKRPALAVKEKVPMPVEKATLPLEVYFPLAIAAVKSFIESKNTVGISMRILKTFDGKAVFLEVSQENGLMKVSSCYEAPIRLLFSHDGQLSIKILFKKTTEINYFNFEQELLNSDVVNNVLSTLSDNYVFCPGIPKEECVGLGNVKNLQNILHPSERFQSIECLSWFIPPANASKEKIQEKLYQCTSCRSLNWYLRDCQKKKAQVTPKTKLKRQLVSSRCRFSALTPRSKRSRILNNKRKRSSQTQLIKQQEKKLIETSLELSEGQDKQMRDVVAEINLNGQKALQEIFQKAMKKNKMIGLALKKAWETNSSAPAENDFAKDNEKCTNGSNGNRWSPLTYRICKAVYSCSPAAYERLRSFDILKLPSCHTLRRKIREIPSKAGIDLIHLKNESKRFDKHSENHPEFNNPPKEGALIFDEVKIIGKMMWNSRNGEFVGTAMDDDENASLSDLFKVKNISEVLEAEYALQYLWRCTTMKFDVIGPYFMFSKPVTHAAISSTYLKCIFAFHCVGFETGIIVCDGGSSNMSALRHSLGISKAVEPSICEDGSLSFRISTKMPNYYIPGRYIYWMVCPSHQLKNMINGLNHSQDKETREFTKNGVVFGWKQIIEMKKREDDRRDNDELVQVKRLQQSHVDRDSWTKLNVFPAKIMQQMEVLGELYNYAHPMFEEEPLDKVNVMACHDYLKACYDIFENGLLSGEKVYGLHSSPIRSMLNGLKYFEEWATERTADKEKMTNNRQFLAWQTFELLRISIYGFIDYVEDFITRHPGRYIYPVRINGSAVETLFSQMKYVTASKLSSINYSSARRAIIIKASTKTLQNAETCYRKVELDVSEK